MRFLLALIIAVLGVADAFALDMSLAPGLSVKNAVLYPAAGLLLLRATIRRDIRFELGGIQAAFVVLIGYAILTMLFDVFVIHLPHYRVLESVIALKSQLIDAAIVFSVFLYGLRSSDDAVFSIKTIAAAVAFGNLVSIADVTGLISLGVTEVGVSGEEAGRVFGAFGHANETAALIVALFPAYLAIILTSRGFARVAWIGAALISGAMFILTGSRGGLVAGVVGGVWGAMLCRKYLSSRMVAASAAALCVAAAFLVLVLSVVAPGLGSTLVDRMIGFNASEGGSGRTAIWQGAIDVMMGSPLSLVSGFGWNSWLAMGFRFVAHNQYLWLWFELGLIGLGSYVAIVWQSVTAARIGIQHSSDEIRPYLIAFVFGSCALAVAIAFTLLFRPWPYIWAYIGASCRIAVETISATREDEVALTQSSGRGAAARVRQGGVPGPVMRRDVG